MKNSAELCGVAIENQFVYSRRRLSGVTEFETEVDTAQHAMNLRNTFPPTRCSPIRWLCFAVCLLQLLPINAETEGQSKLTPIRTAYSALSAGIGTLWLTHEDGHFRKHGLDSNLIYIRGGSTAVQAILAGEIQFGHLSPAPMAALRFAASVYLTTFSS